MESKKTIQILNPDRLHGHAGLMFWIVVILVQINTSGCAALDVISPRPSSTPIPTGTRVVLPATWTKPPPTITPTSSFTPSPTASPTTTSTPTATPSPAVIVESASASHQPDPTTDWSAASLPDCTFTATKNGVRINPAPFLDPYHVLPTMEPGKPYPAVITKPTYTLLVENGQPLGWIDYRLLAVSFEGGDCLSSYDQREVWDFPLCFFTPLGEINGYSNSEFTEPMHSLAPPAKFVVLYESDTYYFTAAGSSGPSFVVKKEEVSLQGNCDDVPALARATTGTSLYTNPPDQGGSIVYTLEVEEPIYLQSRRKTGAPPPGADGAGYWILARRHSWAEDINGWVWSGHIESK